MENGITYAARAEFFSSIARAEIKARQLVGSIVSE
jgi:hypothetical protein